MEWVTVQYTSDGARSSGPITDWGPLVMRDGSKAVVHPVQPSTKALRVDLHKDTGSILTRPLKERKVSDINVVAKRMWVSAYEIQARLPDIESIDNDRGRLKCHGTISKLINPIGSKSFKLKVDDSVVQLEYKKDGWNIIKDSTNYDVGILLVPEDKSGSNHLRSHKPHLYMHSDTTFEDISVLV